MADLKKMEKRLEEMTGETDFHELGSELTSKLALLQHPLLNGQREVNYDVLCGLSYLVSDITEEWTRWVGLHR